MSKVAGQLPTFRVSLHSYAIALFPVRGYYVLYSYDSEICCRDINIFIMNCLRYITLKYANIYNASVKYVHKIVIQYL